MTSSHPQIQADMQSPDASLITQAIWRCTERLEADDWPPPLFPTLIARLVELASHADVGVRQAVAETLAYLPDDAYEALQPKLEKDPSRYVSDEAKRAPGKVAKRKREDAQAEDHDGRLARWYEKLDPAERRIAGWIADAQTEYYVRREHHEVDHVLGDMERRLSLLEAGERGEIAGLREDITQVRRIMRESRENAEPIEPAFRKESLLELLRAQADLLAARFPDRKDRLDVDLSIVDPRLEPAVDAGYLRQALANVLRNAVEAYAPDAPRFRVEVSAIAAGDGAVLAVTDEGSGIPAEQIAGCLVPFGSKKKGGTGFGLYNARRVARQVHGGDLRIRSAQGKGTTVTITLPLEQEEPKAKKRRRRDRK